MYSTLKKLERWQIIKKNLVAFVICKVVLKICDYSFTLRYVWLSVLNNIFHTLVVLRYF